MTDQALVPAAAAQLPAVAPDYVPVAGFEQLPPDDFSLPTLKLVQPQTSNEGAEKHPGEYLKTDTGDYFAAPNVLIVGIAKTRIMFPDEYAADSKAICRSDDGVSPRSEFIGQEINGVEIQGDCATCPFSQWGEDAPPACSLTDNWAAILPTGDPAILRLRGSSAKTSAMLKNIMRANRMKGKATHIKLGSIFTRTTKGQFYVATVTPAAEAIAPEALGTAKMLAGVNLAARAAVEEQEAPAPRATGIEEPDWQEEAEQSSRPF